MPRTSAASEDTTLLCGAGFFLTKPLALRRQLEFILMARRSFSEHVGINLQESIIAPLCPSYQIETSHPGLQKPPASSLCFPFPSDECNVSLMVSLTDPFT